MKTQRKTSLITPALMIALVVSASLYLGCPGSGSMNPDETSMEPSGAALFTRITQTDPFDQWAQFPGALGTVDSAAPHGSMARIFINAEVEAALENFSGTLPAGSIIVKENLGESSTDKADAFTVMWKVSGFNPDAGDWFWANLSPEGQVNAEGALAGCISCHTAAANNDFIFTHEF